MTIHEFKKEQTQLLKSSDVRARHGSKYQSRFPLCEFVLPQPRLNTKNQIGLVNGKKKRAPISISTNYSLSNVSISYEKEGRCGLITPGSIYTDLGAKQLSGNAVFADNDWVFCLV